MRKLTAVSLALFSMMSATAVFAQESGGNYNTAPVTLGAGTMEIHGDLAINLSKGAVAKPIEIAPNFYYGATDQLTLGIATNPFADTLPSGRGPFPTGFCLTGSSNGCPKFFNNLSLDALYEIAPLIALHGGLDLLTFSPDLLASLRVGAKMKFGGDSVGVLLDPALNIGLTKRSYNKEYLTLPVRVGFQATPELNVGAVTGILGPLSHFGDLYEIPLGFSGIYAINETMDVGGQFTFDDLIGKNGSADYRSLALFLNFRN